MSLRWSASAALQAHSSETRMSAIAHFLRADQTPVAVEPKPTIDRKLAALASLAHALFGLCEVGKMN